MKAHLFNNMTVVDIKDHSEFNKYHGHKSQVVITDGVKEYFQVDAPDDFRNAIDSSRHLFFSDTFDNDSHLRILKKQDVTEIDGYEIIEYNPPFPEKITVEQYENLSPNISSKYQKINTTKEKVVSEEILEIITHDNDFLSINDAKESYLSDDTSLRSGIVSGLFYATNERKMNPVHLPSLISMQTGDINIYFSTDAVLIILGTVINNMTDGNWVTVNHVSRTDTSLKIYFHAEKWVKRSDYVLKKKMNGGYYADGRKERVNIAPVVAGSIRLVNSKSNLRNTRQIATIPVDLGKKITSVKEIEEYITTIIDELIGDAINGPQ